MRVIAGKARRLQLKNFEGKDIRPTSDRIKETLFNIIQDDVGDSRFLDLFAGSGAIGIEALSRGAIEAIFVDNSREAIKVIEYNVKHTKMEKESTILHTDYVIALRRLNSWKKKFDIVFIDPPYYENLYKSILKNLKQADILAENCIIIIEAPIEFDDSEFNQKGFVIDRIKNYKNNKHIFMKQEEIYENNDISGEF